MAGALIRARDGGEPIRHLPCWEQTARGESIVVGSVKPERTPLEKEHARQDRDALGFAAIMVFGSFLLIAGAFAIGHRATVPIVAEASAKPVSSSAHSGH